MLWVNYFMKLFQLCSWMCIYIYTVYKMCVCVIVGHCVSVVLAGEDWQS